MKIVERIIGNSIVEILNVDRASIKEAEELKSMLSEKISEEYKNVILDLSACEFIDSTFLGVIVNSLKKVGRLGGDLKLIGFKPAVKAMFELTRLDKIFEVYDNLNDALKSVN